MPLMREVMAGCQGIFSWAFISSREDAVNAVAHRADDFAVRLYVDVGSLVGDGGGEDVIHEAGNGEFSGLFRRFCLGAFQVSSTDFDLAAVKSRRGGYRC